MGFLPAIEIAEMWGVSERSVRNYCAQSRVSGAFLTGKSWIQLPDGICIKRMLATPLYRGGSFSITALTAFSFSLPDM